jgi:hypothetical protein
VRNSPEIEGLGAITHRNSAIGWGLVIAGASLAVGGHRLGVPYNEARGNQFEVRFHKAAITVAVGAIAFGLVAVGIDSLAAAAHARDAEEGSR